MSVPASVSVVIPLYNNKPYVVAAVESALAQTYAPLEVIVADDGSSDGGGELVAAQFARNDKVRLFRTAHGGTSAARNAGIAVARGDFVAFLDSDDIWVPSKLEKQMAIFSAKPDVGAVYCSYGNIDGNGDPVPEIQVIPPKLRGEVFLQVLAGGAISGSASAIVARKAVLDKAGAFDTSLTLGEDWDMWVRLAKLAPFDFVDEPLTLIRRHRSQTQACDNWERRLLQSRNHVRLWSKWPREVIGYAPALNLLRRRMLSPSFAPDMPLRQRVLAPAKIAAAIWPEADPALMRAAWGAPWVMAVAGGVFIGCMFVTLRVAGKLRRTARKIGNWALARLSAMRVCGSR